MVPSKADNKQVALPAAFKDADIPAKEVAMEPEPEVAEPVKRPAKAKPEVAPATNSKVADILSDWATDDDA
jgi:hypothetical protein